VVMGAHERLTRRVGLECDVDRTSDVEVPVPRAARGGALSPRSAPASSRGDGDRGSGRRRGRRLSRRPRGVSLPGSRGPIVIDTDVFGADLVRRSVLAERFEPSVVGRPAFISFQTAAELRYGALRRNWGEVRRRALEARIGAAETVHTGPELIVTYARLRADYERIGHALAQRDHDADRWVAATAMRLGVPLVSNDGTFGDVPGLLLEKP
jgi:tRNA(fMet)-specific endonuclease VapC